MTAEATAAERAAVDALLGPPESGWEGGVRTAADLRVSRAPVDTRTRLLPVRHALQGAVGWISEGGLNYVCERLTVPPAEAYGVATFYAMFSVEERPATVVHVCDDLACRVQGGGELLETCRSEVPGDEAVVVSSPCLGQCERAPAVLVQRAGDARGDVVLTDIAADSHHVMQAVHDEQIGGDVSYTSTLREPVYAGDRLLARASDPGATSLEGYRAHGGYAALQRARELGSDEVIRLVTDAKLLGRGGAAFPTGVKWRGVADQAVTPKYVICNADESEPGTFKDRVTMERDPFAVIEALTIAGFATGAEQGYLYIRGEYPIATRRLESAIAEARAAGLLGPGAFGPGRPFDIEIRRGAGAYICGEETSLFNSIEGKRGEPRNKPPFPVEKGLFAKPTGINNVETLVNVLEVLRVGGLEYAKLGTETSTGTRLFCLSGCVEAPGLYEVEHGTTLRALIDLAGGVRGGRELRAILLGGAAGTFVGPDALDMPLTFEDAREQGTTLGSGVVMLFDDTVDLRDIVVRIAAFFRDESCGQCVPCRVGTVRQEEALHRLLEDRPLGSRED